MDLEYNSNRSKLFIPEYGRHIQKMVDYCVSIEDEVKRNKIAKSIIDVMGNLQPHIRDVPDFKHKLWDQLFIMSDFKIEVESPYEKPQKEILFARPSPLGYPNKSTKYRFYGKNIQSMINLVLTKEDVLIRKELCFVVANHMKKCYLNWNKDSVEDEIIFNHLYELSNQEIDLKKFNEPLTDSKLLQRKRKNNRPARFDKKKSKK